MLPVWHNFSFLILIEVNRQAGTNYLTEECDRIVKQLEQI